MFGLTPLGAIHTAISLIALGAGLFALLRDGRISPHNRLGTTYIVATVLTCLTGFGIFQRGGFGAPHALGIVTLLVLALAALAGTPRWFGRASPFVETVAYSVTFFFHMIPGLTETFTRVPLGAPLFANPEDPNLQKTVGVFFVLLVVGCVLQVRRLRGSAIGREQGAGAARSGG